MTSNKFLGFNKVLCLSPHPDDVEYSMSGTIMKYNGTHFDVVTLTNGGDFDKTNSQPRTNEVTNFWDSIDNVSLQFGINNSFKHMDEAAWINYIETNYLFNHEAILLTSEHDSHFEHRLLSKFGYALTRVKPISLIEYMSPSTQRTWQPNLFINIKEQYKQKEHRLELFKSQQNRSYFQKEQIKGFHTEFQCSKKNIMLTEQFNIKQYFK
jgi:LmbE family N-acetylglucosaminyl deacetylase